MTRAAKSLIPLALLVVLAASATRWCQRADSPSSPIARLEEAPATGGTITAAIRADPRSFNRLVITDAASDLVAQLLHASLMRIDRTTDRVEPWLAERVATSDDGRTHTLTLRSGVTFSDGTPLTSADVVFTFAALYDEAIGSPLADSLIVQGERVAVSAPDALTVVLRFPTGAGPALRALAPVSILPRHKLEAAWKAGTLAKAWSVTTPPSDLAGLGPFVVESHQTGERLVLARNPRYWRRDEAGRALPYLDRLVLEIVPEPNAEVLRFDSGAIDLMNGAVRPDDYAAFRRAAAAGHAQLYDLGVAVDTNFLWFNLLSHARPYVERPWLRRTELRQAISHAVDRAALADTALLGAGVPIHGPVTPGNKVWHAPDIRTYEHDTGKARALLAKVGLEDRNGDGTVEDAKGRPARFSVLVQKGNTTNERTVAVIQQQLKSVGLTVDLVPLDVGSLIDRFNRGDFDAIYHGLLTSDTDPASGLEFWLSSGSFNPWSSVAKTPVTEWERTIDELMMKQMAATDFEERRRLFHEVQRVFSEHLPAIHFVAPRVVIAIGPRVVNAHPSLLRPHVLWSADTLAVRAGAR